MSTHGPGVGPEPPDGQGMQPESPDEERAVASPPPTFWQRISRAFLPKQLSDVLTAASSEEKVRGFLALVLVAVLLALVFEPPEGGELVASVETLAIAVVGFYFGLHKGTPHRKTRDRLEREAREREAGEQERSPDQP
jgi:hypothetical protein